MKEYQREVSHIELSEKYEVPFLEIAGPGVYIAQPPYLSELILGNITIRFTKSFNWFQRFMLKWVFGLDIKNIK